jgi:hypothetical protein
MEPADRLRALKLLADHQKGCAAAEMLAQGFGPAVIVELIEAGHARAKTERVLASGVSANVSTRPRPEASVETEVRVSNSAILRVMPVTHAARTMC